MGRRVTRHGERYELRTAISRHQCFGKVEHVGDKVYGAHCSGVIMPGEQYLISTIFPGHESGRCDGYTQSRSVWNEQTKKFEIFWEKVPGKPITHVFCLNCARDWTDLRWALDQLGALEGALV